jgi:AcrR family transcriptional regulator
MSSQRSRSVNPVPVGGLPGGRARADQLPGGNHGLTPEQVVESQRGRILGAMRELVAGRGYRDVAVATVVQHAGVSRKTFYELYAGKEECFVAIYEREMERVLTPTLQAFEGTEPWVDRLRTALGVLLGTLAADPAAARICFVEVLAAGPLALERRARAYAALDPLVTPPAVDSAAGRGGAAESAGPDGAAAPVPPTSSRAIVAGSVGYLTETLHREIAAGRVGELPALRPQLTRTLTLPFADQGAAEEPAPDAGEERAFVSAYGEIAADMLARAGAAIATDDDPATRVRAGVAALLDFCAHEPERARTCFVEALNAGPTARERRDETTRRLSALFARPLRELRPSDRIAEVSAVALVGGFHELTFDAVDRLAPEDLPTVESVVAVARL